MLAHTAPAYNKSALNNQARDMYASTLLADKTHTKRGRHPGRQVHTFL